MPTAGRIKEDGSESDFYLYQDGMNSNNKLTKKPANKKSSINFVVE
jgi:hypothetical protein